MNSTYKIRCEASGTFYVYWNGVVWTERLGKAKPYATREEAAQEAATLSLPRNSIQGRKPVVFEAIGAMRSV